MSTTAKSWRCNVCGYVHQGENPPEYCPICGASAGEFSLLEDRTAKPAKPTVSKWRCIICNYVYEGDAPPAQCPVCGADTREFDAHIEEEDAYPEEAEAEKVVIIGGGIAGVSAAESIRKSSTGSSITLISSEERLPYYRLNLTRFLAGEICPGELDIHTAEWYENNNIELALGVKANAISRKDKSITLEDGKNLTYDRLILAAGSHPFIPPIPGSDLDGVYTLRTADDAEKIAALATGRRCVCIGGGILGLETAGALVKRRAEVTLLESHDWLMPRQLNPDAAVLMENHLKKLNIRLMKSAATKQILEADGRAAGVELESGEELICDIVILCTGVRPNTFLARKAGLEVNNGVVVDNHLRTSDPSILAAGDIAEHNGVVYGIWGPAQYQGAMAGLNAVGGENLFGGVPRSNTIKVLGIDMFSIGDFTVRDGSYTAVQKQGGENFAHFVFHDGRMTGAILLGDIEAAARIKKAIEQGVDFSRVLRDDPGCAEIVDAL